MMMMYRVLAIVAGGVTLAACTSTPSWMNSMPSWNMDAWKPAPIMETVRFESEPAGAEAKTTTGQTCRTPCALAVPVGNGVSVTFTLNGYTPETEKIELVSLGSEGSGGAATPRSRAIPLGAAREYIPSRLADEALHREWYVARTTRRANAARSRAVTT